MTNDDILTSIFVARVTLDDDIDEDDDEDDDDEDDDEDGETWQVTALA